MISLAHQQKHDNCLSAFNMQSELSIGTEVHPVVMDASQQCTGIWYVQIPHCSIWRLQQTASSAYV